MSTNDLWIIIPDENGSVHAAGKIVSSFGTVVIYDSVDWGLWHSAGKFACSGKCWPEDIKGHPNSNPCPVFFHNLEDTMNEVQLMEKKAARNNNK